MMVLAVCAMVISCLVVMCSASGGAHGPIQSFCPRKGDFGPHGHHHGGHNDHGDAHDNHGNGHGGHHGDHGNGHDDDNSHHGKGHGEAHAHGYVLCPCLRVFISLLAMSIFL